MQLLKLASALLLMTLIACCSDVELPTAEPLAIPASELMDLHGARPGPHTVQHAPEVLLPQSGELRPLHLSLSYPQEGGNYPLLVFSHGNWSDRHSYRAILDHWVSHGYAIIAVDHLDCCGAVKGIFNSLRYGNLGLVEARVRDLRRVLDKLPSIARLHPGFAGKADPGRLGLTGHSFGAFSVQQFGGAEVYDPDSDSYIDHLDPRVQAIVALSPPGPMFDVITADSWQRLSRPTLVTTGTWDIQPGFFDDWRLHLMSWETARPGDQYALVTQGADHFLGNLICRPERDAEPQEDALLMLKIASTTFLDAYLKADDDARALLEGDQLEQRSGGFSVLRRR